jgi:hypothetical protein
MRSTKLLIGAMILAVASLTLAQDSGIRTISGRVLTVDAKASTLVVRPETAPIEPLTNLILAFDGDTKIRKAGLKIKLVDVHPGDVVTANFKTVGDQNLALAVMVE